MRNCRLLKKKKSGFSLNIDNTSPFLSYNNNFEKFSGDDLDTSLYIGSDLSPKEHHIIFGIESSF